MKTPPQESQKGTMMMSPPKTIKIHAPSTGAPQDPMRRHEPTARTPTPHDHERDGF